MSQDKTYWSLDLSIDLYDCDLDKFNEEGIQSFGQTIGEFIDEGRELVGVVLPFGEGEEAMEGFRLVHETYASLITAHFVNSSKKAYINIHSCKAYVPSEAVKVCTDFFGVEKYLCQKTMRD